MLDNNSIVVLLAVIRLYRSDKNDIYNS